MVKTIGNPLTWATGGIAVAGTHAAEAVGALGSHDTGAARPQVHRLTTGDLLDALKLGYEDFAAARTDVMALCVIYPAVGLILAGFALHLALLPLLFPLVAGFALFAPAAAIGFYEISRRREMGESAGWGAAFRVIQSPSFAALLVLGLYLAAIFSVWMVVAHTIYALTLGPAPPESASAFVVSVLTTNAGWILAILGTGVGFCFAVVVLAISVVSFPMLLDRPVGLPVAVATSVRVMRRNPQVVLTWGAIVAGLLAAGSVPLLLGLVIVLPLLGHATWHLYRRAVSFG